MKKLLYFFILIIFFLAISCGSSSDIKPILLGCTDSTAYNYDPLANVDDTSCIYCHECYIALFDDNGMEVGMLDLGEFCGDELEDAESSSYSYAVSDTLYSDNGGMPLPPGEYGPGSADNFQYEIHCHHK